MIGQRPDSSGPRRSDDRRPVAVKEGQQGAHGLDRGVFPELRGEQDARRAADQIEAARGDEGLVEVVDVVEEIAVVGPVGAEVLEMEVTADEDRGADVGRPQVRPVGSEQV